MLTTLDRLFLELIQDGQNTIPKIEALKIFNSNMLNQLIKKHLLKSNIKLRKDVISLCENIQIESGQIELEVQHLHALAFKAREKSNHMYHLKKCKLTDEEFQQLNAMMIAADIFVSECSKRNKQKMLDCYYHINAYGNYYKLFNFNG
jgi:hypothetical protein